MTHMPMSAPSPPEPPLDELVPSRFSRWLGPLFLLAGLGLVPWTIYLAATLPMRHVQTGYYDLAWGGFDAALAAVLITTGIGLVRRRLWVQNTATAAATMLVCDAWFDVLSSSGLHNRLESTLLAVVVELPTAAICFAIARNVEAGAERAAAYALSAGRRRRRQSPPNSGSMAT